MYQKNRLVLNAIFSIKAIFIHNMFRQQDVVSNAGEESASSKVNGDVEAGGNGDGGTPSVYTSNVGDDMVIQVSLRLLFVLSI